MQDHPIANIFPLISEPELLDLSNDIKERGLQQPIWIYEDKILDGRNRYRACKMAGVEPQVKTYTGNSAVGFVISLNLKRRHLTDSQKAFVSSDAKPFFAAEAKKRMSDGGKGVEKLPPLEKSKARDQAAKLTGVSGRYVSEADYIKKHAPESAEQVRRGEKTISEVKRDLRKQETVSKQKEALLKSDSSQAQWTITDKQDVIKCDAVITDPPYGILQESWDKMDSKELDKFTINWLQKWCKCDADLFCIFWSQEYLWRGKELFDEYLDGYRFQQLLIWHYPNNVKPHSREGFKQTWEPVFFYRKDGSTRKISPSGSEWGDLNNFDCHVAAVPQGNFNEQDMKQHPAQKPVSVFKWLINATTQPGEVVCDPFAGSGTSGIASVQLSRKYHGIEIDEKYLALSRERIAAYGK